MVGNIEGTVSLITLPLDQVIMMQHFPTIVFLDKPPRIPNLLILNVEAVVVVCLGNTCAPSAVYTSQCNITWNLKPAVLYSVARIVQIHMG